jgi:hypothetical protein
MRERCWPKALAEHNLWLAYHRDLKSNQRALARRDFLKDVVPRRAIVRIPVKLSTDSGDVVHPTGAKRRWWLAM